MLALRCLKFCVLFYYLELKNVPSVKFKGCVLVVFVLEINTLGCFGITK